MAAIYRNLKGIAVCALAALILLYAFGRGFGPIRVLLGAFRGGITAQNLADWCLALLFALPAAAVIGCAVRYLVLK